MNLIKTLMTILFILLTFQACSTKNNYKSESFNHNKSFPNKSTETTKEDLLYENLKAQYIDWKGVKYKYGGYSKNGIDCSAFVQRTFKDKLNIQIPRTTALQSEFGEEVSIEDLKMGDLVFFKTGFKVRHVGIYLEGGKFLHASTKRGVTISRLDNPYYEKHFWKVIRVLD
jgi:cell wall-associated NlpC family hydrolase